MMFLTYNFLASTLLLYLGLFAVISPQVLNAQISSSSSKYSIADLEILEREKSYQEFFAHAHDVLPSNRGQRWADMAHGMATSYIEYLANQKRFDRQTFKQVEELVRWPSINGSAIIFSKRTTYALAYLQNCFAEDIIKLTQSSEIGNGPIPLKNLIDEDSDPCVADLHDVWNNTPEVSREHSLAMKLGNLLWQYVQTDKLWAFYSFGARSQFAEFYCKERPLILELKVQASKLLASPHFDNEQVKKKLLSLANDSCWTAVFPSYLQDLEGSDLAKFENAFKLLAIFNQLSDEDKDYLYATYLLSDPPQGELFNYAWNSVQILGQKFERRVKAIQKLVRRDPLPGKTFKIADLKRRAILASFIDKNLPEYIDSYGEVCLDYLKGRKSFPNGNPTIECHDLFTSDLKGIKKGLRNEYTQAFLNYKK